MKRNRESLKIGIGLSISEGRECSALFVYQIIFIKYDTFDKIDLCFFMTTDLHIFLGTLYSVYIVHSYYYIFINSRRKP